MGQCSESKQTSANFFNEYGIIRALLGCPPDSFPELVSLVMESESRGTFLTTGTLLIIALVVLGCFFGRKCRRRRRRGKTL